MATYLSNGLHEYGVYGPISKHQGYLTGGFVLDQVEIDPQSTLAFTPY
jgi:hypothetical protein